MHESRTFPRFLPRIGKSVKCTYGAPIAEDKIQVYIDRWKRLCETVTRKQQSPHADPDAVPQELLDGDEAEEIRRGLTKVVRDAVVQLRAEAGYPPEHPLAHHAEFYDSSEGLKYDALSGIPRPAIFAASKRKKRIQFEEDQVYEKEGPT